MSKKLSFSEAPGDRRNLVLLCVSTLIWTIALTAANYSLENNHLGAGLPSTIAAILPMAFGAWVIWTHIRYLQRADELQRRNNLYGMAIGFGVTVVFALSYPVLELVGAPDYDSNEFIIVGVLAYALSAIFMWLRYR